MRQISIAGIPAVLWGAPSDRLFIAVHGDQSHKEDAVIAIFAEEAAAKGYQVLSFDLPEHGARTGQPPPWKVQQCVAELGDILAQARTLAGDISVFGCSLGAYAAMMAYADEPIRQALFLSPVVDMRRLIENMMQWFGVSEERLAREGEIATPAKTLYWDTYQYTIAHPVRWQKPTALLYGDQDALCAYEDVRAFAERSGAEMTVLDGGEHFFHTDAQLAFYRQWLKAHIG